MPDFKTNIISGTAWTVVGQLLSLLIVLVTNIWLSRLLSPTEFGQIGIVMVFILLANVLTESGLGGALIRKKEATKNDYSTVFISNLILSVICYVIIFFAAEYIARYYKDSLLRDLLVVASTVLFINSLQVTQIAKLISDSRFKQKSLYRFVAVLVSSIIGIYLAYEGMGVWALVWIQILTAGFNTAFLLLFEKFYFKLFFSKKSFNELYAFGVNTTFASLLNVGFNNIYQLVLGKYFSLSQTGYFYQAKKLQDVPGGVINMVTQTVMFSSLAKLQDDQSAFIRSYNKITSYFLVLVGFMSGFIYVYSEPIVLLLYGEEWLGAVFYMQLLTISSFFYIQEQINRVIFKVFDKTKMILYLEYVKKSIQAISIALGIYFLDLDVLIFGFVVTNLVGYLINFYYSRNIIDSFNFTELLNLIKIIGILLYCITLNVFLINFFQLDRIMILVTSPLLIVMYFYSVHLFGILNFNKEIKSIAKIYRNK